MRSAAHARDELGISEITTARPVQAALTSAATFSVGAAMPLLMVVVSPASMLVPIVSAASLGFLALLGAIGAKAGGANVLRATARVTFWGALAMALTAGIGKLSARLCKRLVCTDFGSRTGVTLVDRIGVKWMQAEARHDPRLFTQ